MYVCYMCVACVFVSVCVWVCVCVCVCVCVRGARVRVRVAVCIKGAVRICLSLYSIYCADRYWFSASLKNIKQFLANTWAVQIFVKHREVYMFCIAPQAAVTVR